MDVIFVPCLLQHRVTYISSSLSDETIISRCVPTGPDRVLSRPSHELYRLVTFQPGDDRFIAATTARDIELY